MATHLPGKSPMYPTTHPVALGDVVEVANPWRWDVVKTITRGRLLQPPGTMRAPAMLVVVDVASTTCKCRNIITGDTWWFGYDELRKVEADD